MDVRQEGAGSSSQALTAVKSGSPEPKEIPSPIKLGNETDVRTPPPQEFTEDLKADLQLFPEQGSAPLTVLFDASRTFARNGMSSFSYDISWGPEDRKDDCYYLYSGSNPSWTYTFERPGLYQAILDVEDERGNRARVTKVITVFDSSVGLSPIGNITAHPTSGNAPLTEEFTGQPDVRPNANRAAFACWDFNLSDSELFPEGGSISRYGTVVHTFDKPGSYTAGLILMGIDRDAGPVARISINVLEPPPNSPPVAHIIAPPTAGPAPLQVTLEGQGLLGR